jgi:hypothetical protein
VREHARRTAVERGREPAPRRVAFRTTARAVRLDRENAAGAEDIDRVHAGPWLWLRECDSAAGHDGRRQAVRADAGIARTVGRDATDLDGADSEPVVIDCAIRRPRGGSGDRARVRKPARVRAVGVHDVDICGRAAEHAGLEVADRTEVVLSRVRDAAAVR